MALVGGADEETLSLAPDNLRLLIIDASASSRTALCALLKQCSYEVTAVPTTTASLHLLKEHQARSGAPGYDLVLKDHSPPASSACRLLRRLVEDETLKTVPVVVVSSVDDPAVMASCLQLGAADFLIKPLRANELRNLWARVYWWRRAFYLQQQASAALGATADQLPGLKLPYYPNLSQNSGESEETKRGEDAAKAADAVEAERSGEGSAPNGSGSGNLGSSKGANGSSRCQAAGAGDSATKACGAQCQGSNQPQGDSARNNGDSATKAGGGNGNSGFDASTSGQEGAAALRGTAEGKRTGGGSATTAGAGAGNQASAPGSAGEPGDAGDRAKRNNYGSAAGGAPGAGTSATGHLPVSSAAPLGGARPWAPPALGAPGRAGADDCAPSARGPAGGGMSGDAAGTSGAATADGSAGHGATARGTRNGAISSHRVQARAGSASGDAGGGSAGPSGDALTVIRPQPVLAAVHGDAAGFRAYISPAREAGLSLAGTKRKAPVGGAALPEQALARGGSSLASGRTGFGALRADAREGPAPFGNTAATGSLPTAASEDTHAPAGTAPASGGGASGGAAAGPHPSTYPAGGQAPGRGWPLGATATAVHHSQAGMPPGLMPGPYSGPPPFFPQYGMPLPAYAMPGAMTGAFWPGVAGGRGAPAGGHQGGGKADKFNSMSVAYYSAYGPQQMAAAGGPSAHDMEVAAAQQQQQQQLALMYQQSLLLQQYSFAQAAANGGVPAPTPAGSSFGAWGQNPIRNAVRPAAWPPAPAPSCPFTYPTSGACPAANAPNRAGKGMPTLQGPQPARGSSAPDAYAAAAAAGHGRNGATSAREPMSCGNGGSMGGPGGPTNGGGGGCEGGLGDLSAPGEPSRRERRAQALHKYMQKRKNLCFTKKIRYESRKQLAQARPRVKGQFVRVAADASGGTLGGVAASAGDQADASGGAPHGPGTSEGAVLGAPGAAVAAAGGLPAAFAGGDAGLAAGRDVVGELQARLGIADGIAEEDEEDDVVNSPQEVSARASTLPALAQHMGSAPVRAAHGPFGNGGSSPASAAATSNGAARARAARNGNGSSDSGSNSPDMKGTRPSSAAPA